MKSRALLASFLFVLLAATGTAVGQGCDFNITGTWKAVTSDYADGVLYRFAPDGTITVLAASGESLAPVEIATAKYELDDPESPKSIAINTTKKNKVFLYGKSAIKILDRTEASMTCEMPGYGKTRWVKVDPNRYFLILAARRNEFYDTSGSSFPILIKISGKESKIDAVGIYSDGGKSAFGTVPAAAYKHFMKESRNNSEVMLRLEINAAQYERGLKVLQTWERRVRNEELLYVLNIPLNNVLLVKAVAESLNQCSEDFKLYKLTYVDYGYWIADTYEPAFIPFVFFKELRRLNESRHVPDDKFPLATLTGSLAQGN